MSLCLVPAQIAGNTSVPPREKARERVLIEPSGVLLATGAGAQRGTAPLAVGGISLMRKTKAS